SKNPAAKLDDYFDATMQAFTYQVKIYGLPWIGMPAMLYVNLDYAQAAGYDPNNINNWTWDDFQQACIKMTKDANGNNPGASGFDASNVKQYGFSVTPGWPPLQQYIWEAGGEVITPDLKSSPIDSPEAIQGAQYLADLVNKYKCTPSQSVISERGFGDMMKNGQVAMFIGGAADDLERSEGKHIKAFLLPKGSKNRDSWSYIAGMAINAKTKNNQDVVYQAFIDLTQAIQEWKVPAPRKSLATKEGIIKAASYKKESADNIIANMPNMRAPHIFPGYAEWTTVFGDRYNDPLIRGNGTAADLAKQVRPLLEAKLPK
ncbi:MAG: extracellular solute-binding protein, partial [Kiritimatiellota bacterium]|nr:extracellular solute-binding protein [Kiritimatiellota bacterium]